MSWWEAAPLASQMPQAVPAAPAPSVPAPDASTAYGMGLGDFMTLGRPDILAGALNYATHGGAPGSYEAGQQANELAHQQAAASHPIAYYSGEGTGAGLGMFSGGPAALRGAAAAGQIAPEVGTRALGAGLRWGGAPLYAAKTFDPTGTGAIWATGKFLGNRAAAMKARRLGRSALADEMYSQMAANPPPTEEGMSALAHVLRSLFGGR